MLTACGGGGGAEEGPPPPPPAARQASADTLVASGCTGGSASGTVYANAEVEPWAALDPTNPQRILAAWQQDRWSNGGARAITSAVSADGGATWQRSLLPFSRCGGAVPGSAGDLERATDPWVDYTPDGTALVMALAFSGVSLADGSVSAMLASRSTDGGRTWSAPATLVRDGGAFFHDKNTLTADPTAAGMVYAVWDRLDRAGNGPTLLARSTDGGISWEAARAIYSPTVAGGVSGGVSQTIGNRVVVLTAGAERGVLVNLFTQIDSVGTQSTARLGVMRSTDRGLTWDLPVFLATQQSVGTRDAASGQKVRDGGIIASIAAGPDNGLWVVWQDNRFSAGVRDAIALSRSADGGRTWSTPVAINAVPAVAAFTPVVHVRADGLVGVLHYDLRSNTADVNTLPANAWLLSSRDGVTWTETAVAGPFDLMRAPQAGGLFLGDYQGLVSTGTSFIPVLVTTGAQASDPTNVVAPLFSGITQQLSLSRARPWLGGDANTRAALAVSSSDAIGQAMERRIPGWRQRVQGSGQPPGLTR
jgi:hypothetical protein